MDATLLIGHTPKLATLLDWLQVFKRCEEVVAESENTSCFCHYIRELHSITSHASALVRSSPPITTQH